VYATENEFKHNFGDRKESTVTIWKRERGKKQLKLDVKNGTLKRGSNGVVRFCGTWCDNRNVRQ
jgi:hypothetical protein